MADKIKAYRAGETLPHTFDTGSIIDIISAQMHAQSLGYPVESAQDVGKRILLEGRTDAGTNGYDRNSDAIKAVHQAMILGGHSETAAEFVAAQVEKSKVAKRLGISFDEAWNGTGKVRGTNATGKDYEQRANNFEQVKTDPRNKDFFDLIANTQVAPYKANNAFLVDGYNLSREAYGNLTTKSDGRQSVDNLPFVRAYNKLADSYPGQKKGYLAANEALHDAQVVAVRQLREGNINSMHRYDKETLAKFDSKPEQYRKMVEEFAQPMVDIKSAPKPLQKLADAEVPEKSLSDTVTSKLKSLFSMDTKKD